MMRDMIHHQEASAAMMDTNAAVARSYEDLQISYRQLQVDLQQVSTSPFLTPEYLPRNFCPCSLPRNI